MCAMKPQSISPINRHADGRAMLPISGADRLMPAFLQSVGWGPVVFPSRRRHGHCLAHPQSIPFIKLFDADLPPFQEHASGDPLPKAIIRCGCGVQARRVQRRPRTAGAEDGNDGVGAAAIGHMRATTAKPTGVHGVRWQGQFQHSPSFLRDANAGRGRVVWCARTRALGCWFRTHIIRIPVFRIGSYHRRCPMWRGVASCTVSTV